MSTLNSWWNSRAGAASSFLESGKTTIQNPLSCISSASCAFGYSCIGGQCIKQQSPSTGGTSFPTPPPTPGVPPVPSGNCGGPGPTPPNMPPGYSGCASPTPDNPNRPGCTMPTCGHGWPDNYGPDTDCCGSRCCRYTTSGISCYCGDCPSPDFKECNQWCDEYKKSTGEISPACKGRGTCDECSKCNSNSRCETVPSAPCHCAGGSACAAGLQCNGSGDCVEKPFISCCYHTEKCECGESVTTKYCDYITESSGPRGICAAARTIAIRNCKKECQPPADNQPDPDPCFGTPSGVVLCNPSGTPEDGPPDISTSNPGFRICGNSGSITNDETGEICWLLTLCDMTNVPEKCRASECNCHNDCPPEHTCGPQGKCVMSP